MGYVNFETADAMLKYGYPVPVVEIGGIGPQYDDACFVMFLRFWKYMDEHPEIDWSKWNENEADMKFFDELVMDVKPTGSMFHSSLSHALFVKNNGYSTWLSGAEKERIKMWGPHIKVCKWGV